LPGVWKEKDILITVKTYPEYSTKYTETVCTCGILADTMQMIRIYPIKYRYLDGDSKFSKYQWIKAKVRKGKKDPRPESYNIRFFSNLVEESLVNFQCKISQIMKAVGSTFNDFDFIINPFQFAGMDGILTMVQDAITMAFKHFRKAGKRSII